MLTSFAFVPNLLPNFNSNQKQGKLLWHFRGMPHWEVWGIIHRKEPLEVIREKSPPGQAHKASFDITKLALPPAQLTAR